MVTVVSACLTGICCRFDGGHRLDERVLKLQGRGKVVPLCPEQLGGLPIPRPPAEIVGGDGDDVMDGRAKVVDAEGKDVTPQFLEGARRSLKIIRDSGAKKVIMKEKSPSCGVHKIYRNGTIVPGKGVLAALLFREGIEVVSNEDL